MINSLSIENFKSIKRTQIDFRQFTALIGRNAAGKTNILQAIAVLKELVSGESVDVAIGKRVLVLAEALNKDTQEKETSFAVEVSSTDETKYFLEIKLRFVNGNSPGSFIVAHEQLQVKQGDEPKATIYTREENHIGDAKGDSILITVDQKKLFVALFANQAAQSIRDIFQSVKIPESQQIDDRDAIAGVAQANLTGLLIQLRHNQPEQYSEFEKIAKKLLPTFVSITELSSRTDAPNSPTDEGQYLLLFEEKNLRGQLSVKILSAGDIRTLYMIAAAISMKGPSTLILEEIENGIHQQRIEDIIDQLESVSRVKNIQIIFTTHSEKIIDRIAPHEILYVEKDSSKGTRAMSLKSDELNRVREILSKGGTLTDYLNTTFSK